MSKIQPSTAKLQTSEMNNKKGNSVSLSRGHCGLSLPSIRGIQAGKEFYSSMCPLRMVARMFVFDEEELPAELRAQRVLNRARIPEMSSYILKNPRDYVLSALTASIDGEAEFITQSNDPSCYNIGWLNIPLSARILVNDGQHRRAAIQTALKTRPDLGDETVPVTFFLDLGLKRSQQIFADLNRYALRPSMSLNVLYDHRDPWAQLALELVECVPVFTGFTEKERTSLSNRSSKLFTLSGIYQATRELMFGNRDLNMTEKLDLAKDFWNEVSGYMPEWQLAQQGNLSGQELRKGYVSGHTIALIALGRAGAALLDDEPRDWKQRLAGLEKLDWGRSNRQCWERRVMVGDKISNSRHHLVLVCNVVKQALGIRFSDEEKMAEAVLFVKGAEME